MTTIKSLEKDVSLLARQIYRKSLLERMSSPDQLDKMIVITSPYFWLAMVGGAIIVVTVLVWSILGRLPVKLEAAGIFVPDQGAYNLASDTAGIVSSLDVEIGDHVEADDVLFTLADADVQRELDDLLFRREKIEAVTVDSVGDIVTADNRDLINIKTQISAADLEVEQQSAMLAAYQSELAALSKQADKAKAEMEEAKEDYYTYIRSSTDSDVELSYSEAQSVYSQYTSIYINAQSNYDAAMSVYSDALGGVLTTLEYDLESAIESVPAGGSIDIGGTTYLREEIEEIMSKINRTSGDTAPFSIHEDILAFIDAGTIAQLTELWAQCESAVLLLDSAEDSYTSALDMYEEARDDYEHYVDRSARINATKERISAIYSEKNNAYQNLYSQMVNLESNIASLEGQIKAAKVGADVQKGSYGKQFDATKEALLSSIDKEIEKYEYSIQKTRVKATVAGTVSDIKVNVGSAVGQGAEIATIRQFSEENLIVCYIPISSGKKVEPGMEVIVCPTTVNQQEYGHMKADVIKVDDYVATSSSIRSTLGDDMLAQAFTQSGPVVGVTCRLHTDESTASGYWWSNKKGAALMVPEGTMVTADIITEEKAPISMLVPYVKEKLTMAMEPEQNNGGGN